jgi:hypothetical protein
MSIRPRSTGWQLFCYPSDFVIAGEKIPQVSKARNCDRDVGESLRI